MAGPLAGFRVADCSEGIAGPKAAMFLADFGADVVHVELPAGDRARGDPGFAVWNRGKRGLTLDFENEAGRVQLRELLRGADVCVFSRTKDDLVRLGLDEASVLALNPTIVYLHVPPFTPDGPEAWLPESAQLLSAASGASYEQYSFTDTAVDPVQPLLVYAHAMWAAVACAAALVERQRSGFGQAVTVSGMHATLMMITGTATEHPMMNRGPRPGGARGSTPAYRIYDAGDGESLILAALTQAFYLKAFEILGVIDIFADPRLGGEPQAMALPENLPWVVERVERAFTAKPRDEWLRLFREAGIPCGPIWTREFWFDHAQVAAIDMRIGLQDPERGPVEMPGLPVKMSLTPAAVRGPAPARGQDDAPLWQPRPVPAGTAPKTAGPLAGVRVLDLGVVIAGSFPGTLLAELGADVVKVEPHHGDSLRAFAPTWFGYNKGKRSTVIDLQHPEGLEAFYRLVRSADIVFDNYRLGVLERLKVDYESLRRQKPDIICVSVTGFGQVGPLRQEPGFDPVLQCGSGMIKAQCGDSPATFITLPVTDTPTALLAALGGLVALLHRMRTGEGQRATSSLAAASVMMHTSEITRFAGRPTPPRGGQDFQGPSALDRLYKTSDGWLRLRATTPGHRAALVEAGFLPAALSASGDDAAVQQALAAAFAALETAPAVERLQRAAVSAVAAGRRFSDFATREAKRGEHWMEDIVLANGHVYPAAGRYAHFGRTQIAGPTNPAGLGEHTLDVLAERGFSEDEIATLLEHGVIAAGGPLDI